MNRMHDELRDLIAPVALGAATRDEVIQVEAHVRGCEHCRSELEGLRATAGVLALAPEDLEPSPDLRLRIMNEVRAEAAARQTQPVAGAESGPAGDEAAARRAGPSRGAGERSRSWWASMLRPWPAAAVGFAALAAGLLTWNVALQTEEPAPAPIVSADVSGSDAAPGISGRVVFVESEGQVVLQLQGLGPLPDGMAYQLWTIDGGIPTSAGTFSADASGQAVVVARNAADADAIGITAQPPTSTTAPEGPLLVTASLSA
ncbi:MAG: anti-sigma factor [Miltoncostaeaceae bacterium]